MRRNFVPYVLILFGFSGYTQEADLRFSAYVDGYYSYDFSQPSDHQKQYVTQAARHNEFNLNLGMLKVSYDNGDVRGNVGLQTGTYPATNYAGEPTVLAQLINQANAGIRVWGKSWIDMGVLGGHFGYESVFSLRNELYTQALATEYTPYYQMGVQFSSQLSGSLAFRAVVVNGWQNIYETNTAKSYGIGLDYRVSESFSVSYGNYFGNEGDDLTGKKYRVHNNAYASYSGNALKSTVVVDHTQQELFTSGQRGQVLFITWINLFSISEKLGLGARYEYVSDQDNILFTTVFPGFQTQIVSASLNYSVMKNAVLKAEGKYYFGQEDIWQGQKGIANENVMINVGLAVSLEKTNE